MNIAYRYILARFAALLNAGLLLVRMVIGQLRRACITRKRGYLIAGRALLLVLCWMVLFPVTASAHAVLLRSTPTADAVLRKAPIQVQMWFSEALNPNLTTSYVVNAATTTPQTMTNKSTHVDQGNSHIVLGDNQQLDVSLKPNLPPAVYLVFYRTQSAADGHILNGSFLFTLARPNGTIPTIHDSALTASTNSNTLGQLLNGPALVTTVMITLADLGVVFWVGAQLWQVFVFELSEDKEQEQQELTRQAINRFERRLSIPTLYLLLLSNLGILIGQSLVAADGQWLQALDPAALYALIATGRFGLFWIMREVVVILALLMAFVPLQFKRPPRIVTDLCPWINLLLALALLVAVTLSGHAAAVSDGLLVSSVIIDWLHLLAASLWVGGMLYLATTYLPILKQRSFKEQAAGLLSTLPRYSPLAIMGVIIMTVTGPSSAVLRLTWGELFSTAYGLTLTVKTILVGGMLLTSAVHVFFMRPRLKKVYKQYEGVLEDMQQQEQTVSGQHVKELEGRMRRQTLSLSRTLRWEPMIGVVVLLCTGLLTTFAGTLQSTNTAQTTSLLAQHAPAKPLATTIKTTDGRLTVTLNVSPNQQGTNVFTVRVRDGQGKVQTDIGVSIYVSLLNMMDMGPQTVNLLPDGKGNYTAKGDLSMTGSWQFRVEVRTSDNTTHDADAQSSN